MHRIGYTAAAVAHAALELLWPARHIRDNRRHRRAVPVDCGMIGSFDVEQEAIEAGELMVRSDGRTTLVIPNPKTVRTGPWSPFYENGKLRNLADEGFIVIGTISEESN